MIERPHNHVCAASAFITPKQVRCYKMNSNYDNVMEILNDLNEGNIDICVAQADIKEYVKEG